MALVKYFGAIAEKTERTEEIIDTDQTTLSELLEGLIKKYHLKNISISVAVNQALTDIKSERTVNNSDEIALLPPFAGG